MKIYIVAHPQELLSSFHDLLRDVPDVNIVGTQGDFDEAVKDVEHLNPDIVLISLDLDYAYELTGDLYTFASEVKVLVHSPNVINGEWEYDLYHAGAVNLIHGTMDKNEIIRSIKITMEKERRDEDNEDRADIFFDIPLEKVMESHQFSVDEEILEVKVLPENDVIDLWRRYQNLMNAMGSIPREFLHDGIQDPHKIYAFQVTSMLDVFDRVKIADGYTLDYVYAKRGGGGEPFLYTRGKNDKPLETLWDYCENFGFIRPDMLLGSEPSVTMCKAFLPHLQIEASPLGRLHFALFIMLSRRFYLYDHSNYNHRVYILTSGLLAEAIDQFNERFEKSDLNKLVDIDPRPTVHYSRNWSVVRLLTYEMNRGFSFLNFYCSEPNLYLGIMDDVILPSPTTTLF